MNAQIGDEVWYVPHDDHHKDTLPDGTRVFGFVFDDGTPVSPADAKHLRRYESEPKGPLRSPQNRDMAATHTGPLFHWPAIIVALNPDGSAELDIEHPHSWRLGCPNVPHSKTPKSHTWHTKDEEAAK